MCLKCAHHSVWGQIVFTFIYYNSFPTSPLSVAKESTAVEKCVHQPWSWREAPHISTVISLLIHLLVHPLYMGPQVMEDYRYLGVHLDNRLDSKYNADAVYKKGHNRLYLIRNLRSFNICTKMCGGEYSLLCSICWGSSIRTRHSKKLNKPMKKAGSVLGTALESSFLQLLKINKCLTVLFNLLSITEKKQKNTHKTYLIDSIRPVLSL